MNTLRIRIYLLNIIFWATLFPVAPSWYRWLAPILILILLIDELLILKNSKKEHINTQPVADRPIWLSAIISLITILLLIYFLSQLHSLTLTLNIIVVACSAIIIVLEIMEWRKRIREK